MLFCLGHFFHGILLQLCSSTCLGTAKFHAFHNLASWPQFVSVLIYTQLLFTYILHTSFLRCRYGVKVNLCCHGVLRIRLVEFRLPGPYIPRISPLGSTYRCRTLYNPLTPTSSWAIPFQQEQIQSWAGAVCCDRTCPHYAKDDFIMYNKVYINLCIVCYLNCYLIS